MLLDEVKSFNNNLYLCCLLTYGCLLRPHREVRQLRWGDFSDDLKYISIGGDRVKSKRNRIVPVPEFIRKQLSVGKKENNIFTNSPIEFNEDYLRHFGAVVRGLLSLSNKTKHFILLGKQEP